MTEQIAAEPQPLRMSGRARVKSQRVLEHEDTKRLLEAQLRGEAIIPPRNSKKPSKPRNRGKKKDEVYCICKVDNEGPMIECDECNDWFHFACVHLQEDDAEKLHSYICPDCQQRTNKQSIHMYDVESFTSPSPPPGIGSGPPRSKQGTKRAASSDDSDTSSDSGSDALPSAPSSPASANLPTIKKPRVSSTITTTQAPSISAKNFYPTEKKKAIGRSASVSTSALPPMRKYVRDKLTQSFRGLVGDSMDDAAINKLACDVEDSLLRNFKDVVGGKDAAGTRYKTQFNLLNSSLSKGLRPSLVQSLKSQNLSPSQIATLTSSDLASEEQLAEMNRAKQASLEQTVKSKEEVASIRLGRDGFESVEDRREKEMREVRKIEELEKQKEEEVSRRVSLVDERPEKEKVAPDGDVPPLSAKRFDESPLRITTSKRSESIGTQSVQSPGRQSQTPILESRPSFDLTSAWGGGGGHKEQQAFVGPAEHGEMELDLSDIVKDGVPDEMDYGYGPEPQEPVVSGPSEMELFEAKPIRWQGGIINPANPSPHIPPVSLRLISRASPHNTNFSALLPQRNIEITGRVPTKASLQFLSDMRLNPGKELVLVVISLGELASANEDSAWNQMIEYHIGRDRHAIYHPYGSQVPPGAVKELYLIPLLPADAAPEFTQLIDNFSLPSQRTSPIFLGVFIANKKSPPTTAYVPTPPPLLSTPFDPRNQRPTPPQPLPQSLPPQSVGIQNERLQQLMASLNPSAIQNLVGGLTPPVGYSSRETPGHPTMMPPSMEMPHIPPTMPPNMPPIGYTGHLPQRQTPPYPAYPPAHHNQEERQRYPSNGERRGHDGAWERRESDNGWGRRRQGR